MCHLGNGYVSLGNGYVSLERIDFIVDELHWRHQNAYISFYIIYQFWYFVFYHSYVYNRNEFNTMTCEQNGRYFTEGIFKFIFVNEVPS